MELTLDHLHFRCQDPEAAARWFVEMLDGREDGRTDINGWPIVRVELGGQMHSFSPAKEGMEVEPVDGKFRHGLYQLGYRVADLRAALAELEAKGVAIKAGPVVLNDSLTVAFVDGPDGIEIELMQVG